jgi:hypothetical protein
VVTSPDAFSQFWNAAKYPFSRTSSSVGLNYTPYMGKLTNDVFLLYGAFHKFLDRKKDLPFLQVSITLIWDR